jgi:hypothetical protein
MTTKAIVFRCKDCGGRFGWGESPIGVWGGTGPAWFRNGETVWHFGCDAKERAEQARHRGRMEVKR